MNDYRPIVTFDCYGTLIDFDLDGAVRSIVGDRARERDIEVEALIDDLRVIRFASTAGPYQRYQDILRDTLEIACLRHGVQYDRAFGDELVQRVRAFQPFADVHDGLGQLKALGYQIALLTNSDNDLIPSHVKAIDVDFDYVVTAETARAYKPRRQAFDTLFHIIDRPRDFVTHAAQGWAYDIIPTLDMGIRRVWINRQSLPGNEHFQPYHEVFTVPELAELLERLDG